MKMNELSMEDELIKKLNEILQANFHNDGFGVNELSYEIGISRSQLHRKLKTIKGKSISQFIREFRLEKAKDLLKNNVATVSEISYRVGFNSPSYFIKCFRKYFGFSPGETKKLFEDEQKDVQIEAVENDVKKVNTLNSLTGHKSNSFYFRVLLISILILTIFVSGVYFMKKDKEPSTKSIAVLPFNNLSNDDENQHFVDGLVEDILSKLSTVENFKVISRTSSDTYRERGKKTVSQIAKELDVVYILEGSVQKQGDKIRINAQLIDAQNDEHLWSKLYDRNISDVFKIQSEIALQITTELDAMLTSEQSKQVTKSKTTNFKAFEYYNLGRFHWNRRTIEGFITSIEYFENAIAQDSLYGLAYAGLADTYNLMAIFEWMDKEEGRNKAVELAKRALELDPSLAEAHNVLASIYTYIDWNWELAEKEYLEAIKLNPNYSTAYHYYSEHLSIVGRHIEARKMIDKAIELDPLSFVIRHVSAKLYFGRGEFEKSMVDNKLAKELHQNHPWVFRRNFLIHYYQKEYEKAYTQLKAFFRSLNIKTPSELDTFYTKEKMVKLIKLAIEEKTRGFDNVSTYALLGEKEKVLDIIDEQIYSKNITPEITFDYVFRFLYNDKRFRDLLAKMNLPESSPFHSNENGLQ